MDDTPWIDSIVGACKAGHEALISYCKENCPDAINGHARCIYTYESEDRRRLVFERMTQRSILADELSREALEAMEPILRGATASSFGISTNDFPFDSRKVLSSLAIEAAGAGGEFLHSRCQLMELDIVRAGDVWRINDGERQIAQAPLVLSAIGALIPEQLRRLTGHNGDVKKQTSLVVVLHKAICSRVISVRPKFGGTVDLSPSDDVTIVILGDYATSRIDEVYGSTSEVAVALQTVLPAIVDWAPCGAHFYTCEKLNNTDYDRNPYPASKYGARHYFWIEEPDGLISFYPGKFTTAPNAADALIDRVIAPRIAPQGSLSRQVNDPPQVSWQPYFDQPSHILKRRPDGLLIFERIDP